MTQEKTEQNRVILELRDTQSLSWGQILEELHKRGLTGLSSPATVKMKYYAVKSRQPASKPAKQQPGKLALGVERAIEPVTREAVKPAKQQASKLVEYKKVTYYLDPAMAKDIKRLALEQDKDISELVRQIFRSYLKGG